MLTQKTVKALRADPERGDHVVWDRVGFGVRVRASGALSWVVVYRNRDGIQRRMTIGTPDKVPLALARKEAQRLLAEAALGRDPAAARIETKGALTVSAISEKWFADLEKAGRKPRGIAAYRWYWSKYLEPRFGKRRAQSVTPKEVRALYRELKDAGKLTLANRVLGTLSAMMGWAARWDMIPSNPCAGAVASQDRAKEAPSTRFLSEPETGRFLAACASLRSEGGHHGRMADAFRLMLLCGLRPSEVYGLRWSEIDLEAGVIRFATQKSGDAPAHLPGPALALLAALDRGESAYVFPSPRKPGAPVESGRTTWEEIAKRAAFDDPRPGPKALRKSFASLARGWGHGLEVIGPALRHSEGGSITSKHYAHADGAVIAKSVEVISSRLAALANPPAPVVKLRKAK